MSIPILLITSFEFVQNEGKKVNIDLVVLSAYINPDSQDNEM